MNLLENIVPGLSAVLNFYRDALGVDITSLLSAAVVIFGLFRYGSSIYDRMLGWASYYCTRSIVIPSDDWVYEGVLTWMAKHKLSSTSTSLRLNEWTAQMNEEHKRLTQAGADSHVKFDDWEAYVWYHYEPLSGSYWVWHKRNLFIFDKRQYDTGGTYIELRCVGFSTTPIKRLIDECTKEAYDDREKMTSITRPVLKDDSAYWASYLTRPVRPLDSVIMDSKEKVRVIADINEYLLTSTQRWYNRRGIPHRRGYFFHGAPGTGKTSFSYAIAGYFGIPIFTLSLLDSKLTEGKLSTLFDYLSDRCVLLMEDIDSVGFEKRDDQAQYEVQKRDREAEKKISLSSFLNAIDGASSREGRILIMTSNYPERLDPALVRPGRVDVWVEFKLATRAQIRELFMHIYAPSTPAITEIRWYYGKKKTTVSPDEDKPLMSRETLETLAKEFAEKLPEGELSPARIQGFLLTRKKDPRKALDEVDDLIREYRQSREWKERTEQQSTNAVEEVVERIVVEPHQIISTQDQPEMGFTTVADRNTSERGPTQLDQQAVGEYTKAGEETATNESLPSMQVADAAAQANKPVAETEEDSTYPPDTAKSTEEKGNVEEPLSGYVTGDDGSSTQAPPSSRTSTGDVAEKVGITHQVQSCEVQA